MLTIPHPATAIPSSILSTLTDRAAGAEILGMLHPAQLEIIYREKWFKMFVPAREGGLGLSLPEVLRLEEALAWADGSTAWVVTLCGGAGWFSGFLSPELREELFASEDVCVAGSGAATGTAEIADDGYIINGEWKYASGALHATAFTANCVVTKDGVAVNDDGNPRVRTFVFLRDEVSLKETWSGMGMVSTASHSFSVGNRFVRGQRSFVIDSRHATLPDPVYQFPFLQLAEATLAVNISGMAQRFLDLMKMLFEERAEKDQAPLRKLCEMQQAANTRVQLSREPFYRAIEVAWKLCESGGTLPDQILDTVSMRSRELYLICLQEAQALYRHGGLRAADPRTELNRVWRNIHTASQHALFSIS